MCCACVSFRSNIEKFRGIFQFCAVANFKIASTSGSGRGGKRKNSGQKRVLHDSEEAKKEWDRCHKRIYLETNIFKPWLQAKLIAGYEACTDSVSQHICCHWNFVGGKFCFCVPVD